MAFGDKSAAVGNRASCIHAAAGREFFPNYSKDAYQPTVIVPYGVPVQGAKELEHWRNSDDRGDFSEWILEVCVWKGGAEFQRFVTDRFDARGRLIDPKDDPGPVEMLCSAVNRAARSKKDNTYDAWLKRYLTGGAGQSALLPNPAPMGLVQGALYEHKGKAYEKPILDAKLFLPASVNSKIVEKLEKRKEDGSLEYGNPVDANAASRLSVFVAGSDKAKTAAVYDNGDELAAGGNSRDDRGEKPEIQGYDMKLERWVSPKTGNPLKQPRNKDGTLAWAPYWRPWNQVIVYLDDEAQFRRLCTAFRQCPDIFEYTFGDASNKYYEFWKAYAPKALKAGSVSFAGAAPAAPVVSRTTPSAAPMGLQEDESVAETAAQESLPAPGEDEIPMTDNPPEEVTAEAEAPKEMKPAAPKVPARFADTLARINQMK